MALSVDRINKIRPLHDRILIKRQDDKTLSTPGGIIIPEVAKERAQVGIIIAVGTGKMLANGAVQPMTLKVNEEVFFGKYAGTEITEDYLILREDEILGVL